MMIAEDTDEEGWQDVAPDEASPAAAAAAPASASSAVDLTGSGEFVPGGGSSADADAAFSPLGRTLAEPVAKSVAASGVRVASPLAAAALAVHAALRTDAAALLRKPASSFFAPSATSSPAVDGT